MLKNVHPLLSADLLHLLSSMGHGDELAIVDRNFPAVANARRHFDLPGVSATDVLDAVLTVFPIDDFVDPAIFRMEVVGKPESVPEVCQKFSKIVTRHEQRELVLAPLERFKFYQRAQSCFGIVSTGETRAYGNILLIKGVV